MIYSDMDRGENVRGQNSTRKTEGLTLNKDGVLFEDKLKEKNVTCLGMMLVIWENM